jgi:hypothetical protein
MTMEPRMTRFVKEGVEEIFGALSDGKPLSKIGEGVATLVAGIPNLNVRDRAHLWDAMMAVARRAKGHRGEDLRRTLLSHQVYDPLIQACNQAQLASSARAKALGLASEIASSRARPHPTVLYLCSSHQKPAEGHSDYQGRVYVDRMWRSTLAKAGFDGEIPLVEEYVATHHTLTVQEAIRGPIWLTTRPNCKHFFIPLDTEEALGRSLKEIRLAHPEAMTGGQRSLTDAERYARYKALREDIDDAMAVSTAADE